MIRSIVCCFDQGFVVAYQRERYRRDFDALSVRHGSDIILHPSGSVIEVILLLVPACQPVLDSVKGGFNNGANLRAREVNLSYLFERLGAKALAMIEAWQRAEGFKAIEAWQRAEGFKAIEIELANF